MGFGKFDFGGLHNRQFGRLFTFKDATGVNAHQATRRCLIAHKAASRLELPNFNSAESHL
jgi:hypothetical protein